jgi:enoyl-CoA hydratase/carnithine racemase
VAELRVPIEIDPHSAAAFRAELEQALARADGPLVLRGGADFFCRGVSLDAISQPGNPAPAVRDIARAIEQLMLAPVATIAVVEGAAVGGGLGLAAACDQVLATPCASFAMPELLYGLVPVVILPALRRRLSPRAFMAMVLSGSSKSAEQARQIGLIDELVAEDACAVAVAETIRRLGRVDAKALGVLRTHLHDPQQLREAMDRAVDATAERIDDPVVKQRLRAYLEGGAAPWA